jgi:hypothetical protein
MVIQLHFPMIQCLLKGFNHRGDRLTYVVKKSRGFLHKTFVFGPVVGEGGLELLKIGGISKIGENSQLFDKATTIRLHCLKDSTIVFGFHCGDRLTYQRENVNSFFQKC